MFSSSIFAKRMAHLGKILSNFAILGVVLCLASAMYFLLVAFYYIVLALILLCTLFLILVYYPDFMELFSSADTINAFVSEFSVKYVPVIAPVTLAVSALAILLLALSRQRNVGRIVLAANCFVAALVFTIIYSSLGV